MPESPITWQALAAVIVFAVTLLGGLAALARYIHGEFARTRDASEDGRRRLHERIDTVMVEVRAGFVPRELHEAHLKLLQHADTELGQQLNQLAERLNAQCPLGMRKGD